jgi:hypothetical protein
VGLIALTQVKIDEGWAAWPGIAGGERWCGEVSGGHRRHQCHTGDSIEGRAVISDDRRAAIDGKRR